jgi:ribosomal protein L11 methyltransferase
VLLLSPRVFLYGADDPLPETIDGAIALRTLPHSVFGDGSHPTTRLCAVAVDHICRTSRPESLLDVGTGTGVLARIARARGVPVVFATDIDPEALKSAREHAALDGEPIAIDVSNRAPDGTGQRFDLVVANILEGVLRRLEPELTRAVAPGGALIVSGFTRAQVPALRTAFSGLQLETESYLDEWALLLFRK